MSIELTQDSTAQELIEQQQHNLHTLEELLLTEKEILQQQNPDKLVKVTEDKNNLLTAIQSLDKTLSQNILFKQGKESGIFDVILSDIEATLLRCKDKNHVNGQVIQQSQLAVDRMKTSLLTNHNKSSMTYDNKGKTHGGLSSLGLKA
jgi:flagella synthesis protein FlgN